MVKLTGLICLPDVSSFALVGECDLRPQAEPATPALPGEVSTGEGLAANGSGQNGL